MVEMIDTLPVVAPADHVPGTRQGNWTYERYAQIPDDGQRYEVIYGVLFMAPAPTIGHQGVSSHLLGRLMQYVEFAGKGRVFHAPCDVELAPDVVVQPDIVVVLNDNLEILTPSRIIGARDLVIEIASPSTAAYDRRTKQDAYARAGVREYWLVDPATRTIELMMLEHGAYRVVGVYQNQALLPSKVVPDLPVRVAQFFV
jgi:Uma2 family endonuclease